VYMLSGSSSAFSFSFSFSSVLCSPSLSLSLSSSLFPVHICYLLSLLSHRSFSSSREGPFFPLISSLYSSLFSLLPLVLSVLSPAFSLSSLFSHRGFSFIKGKTFLSDCFVFEFVPIRDRNCRKLVVCLSHMIAMCV